MDLKKLTAEAYQAIGEPVALGPAEFDFIEKAATESARHRSRILCHKGVDEVLHEMAVAVQAAAYVRPNRHRGKDEAVLVARGDCTVIFFDDDGSMTGNFPLSAQRTTRDFLPYYIRIPANVWHTVVAHTDCVLLEATPGPFDPADTEYAPWSPAEEEAGNCSFFSKSLPVADTYEPLTQSTSTAWTTISDRARFSKLQGDFLRERLKDCGEGLHPPPDRNRICVHHSHADRLHEMLLALAADAYVRPSCHTKDESVYVVEGLGRYVFFSDDGTKAHVVPLGPVGSGPERFQFCRVPRGVVHTLLLETPMLLKETTSGPFRKEDTSYPPWSPPPGEAGTKWMQELKAKIGGAS
jgi:cupin fold WbuC family metalloprotein